MTPMNTSLLFPRHKRTIGKIKILQFPIANSFGGITQYALNNWKWLDKRIFECDFATMSKSLFFAPELEKTGSHIHYISCYAEQDRELFIKEFSHILVNGYDVVHLHTKQWKGFLVEELCRECGVKKVIVHSHSSRCDNNDDALRVKETEEHYKIRKLFNESLATDFWACSKLAADWLFGESIPKSKIKIMNNAIETDKFVFNSDMREKLREKYNLKNKIVLGNVGRLVYQKNQSFLLDVFAQICKKRNDCILILIGEGDLEARLRRLTEVLNVSSKVLFLGKKANVNEFYNMMDLFLLPSNFEGLPITLVEAQAAGLKCIASNAITKEVALSENISYLPLEKEIWVEQITKIISEQYERINMKEFIMQKGFDIAKQIKIIESEYKKVRGGVTRYNIIICIFIGLPLELERAA